MKQADADDTARIRAQAAAEEREAIIRIVEHNMRQLAYGHGASGAQVLQQVLDEIQRRGSHPL